MSENTHLTYSFLLNSSADSVSRVNQSESSSFGMSSSEQEAIAGLEDSEVSADSSLDVHLAKKDDTAKVAFNNSTINENRAQSKVAGLQNDMLHSSSIARPQYNTPNNSSLANSASSTSLNLKNHQFYQSNSPLNNSAQNQSTSLRNVGVLHTLDDLNNLHYGESGKYQGLLVTRIHNYRYFELTGSIPVYSNLIFSKLNKVVDLPNTGNLTAMIYRAFRVENTSGQSQIRFELHVVGKTYFIADNTDVVHNAYLQNTDILHKTNPSVIAIQPINWYREASLNQSIAHLDKGTKIAIKAVIPLDDAYLSKTCLETQDGYYITGNTNYVRLI